MTDIVDIGGPSKPRRKGFQPGVSGNPKGKPPGTLSKATKLRQQLEDDLPQILATLKELALGGDLTVIKLLLERTLPPLKSGYAPVSLPDAGDSLAEQGAAVLQAMTTGVIPPDAGGVLLQGLQAQARLVETQELTDRIAALESLLRQRNEQ